MKPPEGRTSRRELLRSLARGAALAALGAGATALALRNAVSEDCRLRIPCAECALRGKCTRRPAPAERPESRRG